MKYGLLTIIKEVDPFVLPSGQKNKAFLCLCDCGKEKVVRKLHLVRGTTLSCGCLSGERHGKTGTHVHNVWRGMITRCHSNNPIQPHLYKEKGIVVCDEWRKSFVKFYNWAINNGYSRELQIDRIDNSKGYNPDNCRWVTSYMNMNNRDSTMKVIYKNKEYAFMDLIRIKKLEKFHQTIRHRISRGWSIDMAFDVKIKQGNYKKLSKEKGIPI